MSILVCRPCIRISWLHCVDNTLSVPHADEVYVMVGLQGKLSKKRVSDLETFSKHFTSPCSKLLYLA